MILEVNKKMKKIVLPLITFLFSFSGFGQEFTNDEDLFFFDGKREINTSLSILSPSFETQKFVLREVNFLNKEIKRQVNVVAMMQEERREQRSHLIELDAPAPTISQGEKSLIEVTNQIQFHNRSSNYDIYTGKKKIPAYEEMRSGLLNPFYVPHSGGRRNSPFSYSAFIR